MSGMFISLEGGEGAGKSTLLHGLKKRLHAEGYPVVVTREPGGCSLSEAIRELLLNPEHQGRVTPDAELLLFLASRVQHLAEVITPALEAGKIVLCDRFNDSSIAYQGGGRSLGLDKVATQCELACNRIQPDITFLLDIDPKEGLNRVRGRHGGTASSEETHVMDRIESETLAFHQRVQMTYLHLAMLHPERITVLDATMDREALLEAAYLHLQPKLADAFSRQS